MVQQRTELVAEVQQHAPVNSRHREDRARPRHRDRAALYDRLTQPLPVRTLGLAARAGETRMGISADPGHPRRDWHRHNSAPVAQAVVDLPDGFRFPPVRSISHAIERLSVAILVSVALVQVTTGFLNVLNWYPFPWYFL
ncbi:MAG TPA: hypothetical protein VI074_07930, partial [Propionibacteriaceae bacterium]